MGDKHKYSLYVTVLGKFSIQRLAPGESALISPPKQEGVLLRQHSLLQYLCVFHDREISQDELIDALWEADGEIGDSANTLKNSLYRARLLLEELGLLDVKQLLRYRRGFYSWAPELTITLDVEVFDNLCEQFYSAPNTPQGVEAALRALKLYTGEFLPNAADSFWTMSPRTYYHGKYLKLTRDTADSLYHQDRLEEAMELCRTATTVDPYDEDSQLLMLKMFQSAGLTQTAIRHYDQMSRLFMEQLGVTPSAELVEFYQKLTRSDEPREMNLYTIRAQLLEDEPVNGAYFCEYFVFQNMYRLIARSTMRTGQAIQLAMTVLLDRDGEPLPLKRCTEAMEALHDAIYWVLRTGDIFTRFSKDQYLILLPSSSHENAALALERVIASFQRTLSGMTTRIQYSILPVLPPDAPGAEQPVRGGNSSAGSSVWKKKQTNQ